MKRLCFLSAILGLAITANAQSPKPSTGWYFADEKKDSSLFVTGSKDSLYIYPTPVITVKDMKKLKIVNEPYGSILQVTLTEAGKEKMAEATRKWKGKKLAFIVDGILEMAPVVQAEITEGKVSISGLFTNAELKALKKKLETQMEKK